MTEYGLPGDPVLTVIQRPGGLYEVTARQGSSMGWALQRTEAKAREKALLRLRAYKEGWFDD